MRENADVAGIMYHASHTQTVFHGRLGSRRRGTEPDLLRIDTPDDINDSDPRTFTLGDSADE
jgi:hypothetical protein